MSPLIMVPMKALSTLIMKTRTPSRSRFLLLTGLGSLAAAASGAPSRSVETRALDWLQTPEGCILGPLVQHSGKDRPESRGQQQPAVEGADSWTQPERCTRKLRAQKEALEDNGGDAEFSGKQEAGVECGLCGPSTSFSLPHSVSSTPAAALPVIAQPEGWPAPPPYPTPPRPAPQLEPASSVSYCGQDPF